MGKTCDVCGKDIGFLNKFRYADGYICKECYAKASRQFTETIRKKNLMEIQLLCRRERDVENFKNFQVTGKIGNYLLTDEKNMRFCIPNNRMTNREISEPEFYDVAEIKRCEIRYLPNMTFEEVERKMSDRKCEEKVEYLKLYILFKDGRSTCITLISNRVRLKSYAFRQSFRFAMWVKEELERMIELEKNRVA